jgi:hypothetical protein
MKYSLVRCLRRRRGALLSGAMFTLGALCVSTPLFAADFGKSADPVSVQGYLSGKYVYRSTSVDGEKFTDQDLFTDLRVDITKPRTNGYEFHFFGTLRDDFSSNRNATGFSPFEDIGDAYKDAMHGYLYEAHLDVNNPTDHVTQIRMGRQDGLRDEPVFFDGVAADFSINRIVGVSAYGGAAVHFFPFSANEGGNTLGGLGVDVLATQATLVSLDYLSVSNKQDAFDTKDNKDQEASLRINHRFSPNARTMVKVRTLDGETRDANVRVVGTSIDYGAELNVAYYNQFMTIKETALEFSPYFTALGPSVPFQSYDIRGRKLFGDRVSFDLGYFQRTLAKSSDESTYNHDFSRVYGTLGLYDLFVKGFSISITDEEWKTGTVRTFNSSGIDIGYQMRTVRGQRGAKFNVGSYFSLYKYDDFFNVSNNTAPYAFAKENQNVTSYYFKFDVPFAKRYVMTGSYEFEHSIENYQTAKLGMRYEF